jgi:hypothetical protein
MSRLDYKVFSHSSCTQYRFYIIHCAASKSDGDGMRTVLKCMTSEVFLRKMRVSKVQDKTRMVDRFRVSGTRSQCYMIFVYFNQHGRSNENDDEPSKVWVMHFHPKKTPKTKTEKVYGCQVYRKHYIEKTSDEHRTNLSLWVWVFNCMLRNTERKNKNLCLLEH